VGVADRTLKTFDYISKGLLPLDDSLSLSLSHREKTRWKNKYSTAACESRQRGCREVTGGSTGARGEGRGQSEEEERLGEIVDCARIRAGLGKESSAWFLSQPKAVVTVHRTVGRLVASSAPSTSKPRRNPLAASIYRLRGTSSLCLNTVPREREKPSRKRLSESRR